MNRRTYLRIGKMQEIWRVKIAKRLEAPNPAEKARGRFKRLTAKYALPIVAFITVSREGIEGVVISGVSFAAPAAAKT